MKTRACHRFVFLATAAVLTFGAIAGAEQRFLHDTRSHEIVQIERDDRRDRIYVLDRGSSDLVVLHPETETITHRIPLGAVPNAMGLDARMSRALITTVTDLVVEVKLSTLTTTDRTFPHSNNTSIALLSSSEVAYVNQGDGADRLYSNVYQYNFRKGNLIREFSPSTDPRGVYLGLLKTYPVPTGSLLYVGVQGIVPSTIYKIAIPKGGEPIYLQRNEEGAIGGFLIDYEVGPWVHSLYAAIGLNPGLSVIDASSISGRALYWTGTQVRAVSFDNQGRTVYVARQSNYAGALHGFDSKSGDAVTEIPLATIYGEWDIQAGGLAIDRRHTRAFVVHRGRGVNLREAIVQVIDLD